MKNQFKIFVSLITLLFLTFFANAQTKKETGLFYCVQVFSTENPQLLKPATFIDMTEKPYVEPVVVRGRKWYRIIFIYNSVEDQEKGLAKWSELFEEAIKVTKTESQIQQMALLFENF
jgi:hypothetical protein